MLHKLKRTVAVVCLLATACFAILWMRSLKQWDYVLHISSTFGMLEVGSSDGLLALATDIRSNIFATIVMNLAGTS